MTHKLELTDDDNGRRLTCPDCGRVIYFPLDDDGQSLMPVVVNQGDFHVLHDYAPLFGGVKMKVDVILD